MNIDMRNACHQRQASKTYAQASKTYACHQRKALKPFNKEKEYKYIIEAFENSSIFLGKLKSPWSVGNGSLFACSILCFLVAVSRRKMSQ